jgi:hypothetical protein
MPVVEVCEYDTMLHQSDPIYVVDPLLEAGVTGMIYGESWLGKSFVALDLAMSIATGLPWAGMATAESVAVYITAEGTRAFGRRMKAWAQFQRKRFPNAAAGFPDDYLTEKFFVIPHAVEIVDPNWADALITAIRNKVPENEPIGLVVIDTLARNAITLDENSSRDMTRFVDAMVNVRKALRSKGAWWDEEEYGIAGKRAEEDREPVILAVHHTGKPSIDRELRNRGPIERGSSGLKAALDVSIGIEPRTPLRLIVQKLKDGTALPPMRLDWHDTEIVGRHHATGKDITGRVALVGEPGSAPTVEEQNEERKRAKVARSTVVAEGGQGAMLREKPTEAVVRALVALGGDGRNAEVMREADIEDRNVFNRAVADLIEQGRAIRPSRGIVRFVQPEQTESFA